MKHAPTIAGILLGAIFLLASVPMLLHLIDMSKMPQPAPGSADAMFMGAFYPTGYLTFVKVLELVGAILVIIPKTRNFGLLVLGPIIINIFAYTLFIKGGGKELANPLALGAAVLSLYLLWDARHKFVALKN